MYWKARSRVGHSQKRESTAGRIPFYFVSGRHGAQRVNPPEIRGSFGPRALDAWYVGLAYNHYRCWQFFIPLTGGIRTSGQAHFYLQHCIMQIKNHWDEMKRCAIELVDAIKKLTAEEEVRPRRQIEALQKLSDIFKLNLGKDKAGDKITATTLATPTTRTAIIETPRVHGRLTRNNTLGILPTFEGGKQKELLATSEGEKQRKKAKV